jgi:polyisoprenyl-phosphate glycosyltransferase
MVVLSVVIPLYNESSNILMLHERLHRVLQHLNITYELIFINDGSVDDTIALVKHLAQLDSSVRYIDFSRNFGHQIAVSAGLNFAQGEKIVIIDADLQDPPELIAALLQKSAEGYEVVYAKRTARKGETWLKKQTAKGFYRILKAITNIEIPLDTGDFRIMDKKVVEILNTMPEQHKFLRGQIAWVGFRQTYIEYERAERQGGTTGYTFRKMIRFALDGITAFSDLPLKIVTWFGFLVSFVAFLVIIFAFYSRFIIQDYEKGWTSIMVSVLFIGGIQMIAIGIIGEYLSRMNSDIRKRPLYIIRESNIEQTIKGSKHQE